jgi:hypothetical protein
MKTIFLKRPFGKIISKKKKKTAETSFSSGRPAFQILNFFYLKIFTFHFRGHSKSPCFLPLGACQYTCLPHLLLHLCLTGATLCSAYLALDHNRPQELSKSD